MQTVNRCIDYIVGQKQNSSSGAAVNGIMVMFEVDLSIVFLADAIPTDNPSSFPCTVPNLGCFFVHLFLIRISVSCLCMPPLLCI